VEVIRYDLGCIRLLQAFFMNLEVQQGEDENEN
jgi:hypothetical protein